MSDQGGIAMVNIKEIKVKSNPTQPKGTNDVEPMSGWVCGGVCSNGMACGFGCGYGVGGSCGFGCAKSK